VSVLAWAEKAWGREVHVAVFVGGCRYARHAGPYQTLTNIMHFFACDSPGGAAPRRDGVLTFPRRHNRSDKTRSYTYNHDLCRSKATMIGQQKNASSSMSRQSKRAGKASSGLPYGQLTNLRSCGRGRAFRCCVTKGKECGSYIVMTCWVACNSWLGPEKKNTSGGADRQFSRSLTFYTFFESM